MALAGERPLDEISGERLHPAHTQMSFFPEERLKKINAKEVQVNRDRNEGFDRCRFT